MRGEWKLSLLDLPEKIVHSLVKPSNFQPIIRADSIGSYFFCGKLRNFPEPPIPLAFCFKTNLLKASKDNGDLDLFYAS